MRTVVQGTIFHSKYNDTLFNYNGEKKRCQAIFAAVAQLIFFIFAFRQKGRFFHANRQFLKVSRILKRRTVAQEACDGDKVLLNGKPAKPSRRRKARATPSKCCMPPAA